MNNIPDEIIDELAKTLQEEIDRGILEGLISSLPKTMTINSNGTIIPKGYSKYELETIFSWLNEHAGPDGWSYTGRVFYVKDPKVKTMFVLRWS